MAKLQKRGAGAPQREPVVSEDEQKAMIAFYHKKQQEVRPSPTLGNSGSARTRLHLVHEEG